MTGKNCCLLDSGVPTTQQKYIPIYILVSVWQGKRFSLTTWIFLSTLNFPDFTWTSAMTPNRLKLTTLKSKTLIKTTMFSTTTSKLYFVKIIIPVTCTCTCGRLFDGVCHIMKKLIRCFYCNFNMCHAAKIKKFSKARHEEGRVMEGEGRGGWCKVRGGEGRMMWGEGREG